MIQMSMILSDQAKAPAEENEDESKWCGECLEGRERERGISGGRKRIISTVVAVCGGGRGDLR
ncbi:unnamed protein product [Camellia sinensis]